MNNNNIELSWLFNDVIQTTLSFLNEPNVFSYEEWREKIEQQLNRTAVGGRENIDPRDYDDARFAICAWIDEAVMNSPWIFREQWKSALLQETYYNTTRAGDEFFIRLENIKDHQRDLLKIYVEILLLGFKGRYGFSQDRVILNRTISALKQRIAGRENEGNDSNVTISTPLAYKRSIRRRYVMIAAVAVLALAIVVTNYMIKNELKILLENI